MTAAFTSSTSRVLVEIDAERSRQNERWGEQNYPSDTGHRQDRFTAEIQRERCKAAADAGTVTWRHIICEELAEAFAEASPAYLREELVQVAAVAVAWIECLDREAARVMKQNPSGERSTQVQFCRVDLYAEVDENGYCHPGASGMTSLRIDPAAVRGPALDAFIAAQLERLVDALRSGQGLIAP